MGAKAINSKIPSLNGLRACSIACVLFAHIQLRNFSRNEGPGGQIGVTIFFVLSGFLITLMLLNEERSNGSISLKKFYIRRAIRIFPVYYFILFVYFLLQLCGILYFSTISWITSLTYTKYFSRSDWETGHFWSLSVEEHFYLIWPLVFKWLRRYRVKFALLIVFLVPLVRLKMDNSGHLFTRADALMWGCLFAIYFEQIKFQVYRQRKLVLLIPFFAVVIALLSKTILKVTGIGLSQHILLALLGSYGTITNISIGLIIVISIMFTHNAWFNFLNHPIMNYLGVLSYSIYIWQQLFFSPNMGTLTRFPINILCIFIIANGSYWIIEKPFLRWKKKFKAD